MIDFAIFCNITVFPDLGGATIIDLCPAPTGATISIILDVRSLSGLSVSRLNFFSGYKGVKLSKLNFKFIIIFTYKIYFISFY